MSFRCCFLGSAWVSISCAIVGCEVSDDVSISSAVDSIQDSCEGVDCGAYPNVCRGGVCVVGTCADDDLICPAGMSCVDGQCSVACQRSDHCRPHACVDGVCQPCAGDLECGQGWVCERGECSPFCDETACADGEVCDVEAGRCVTVCLAGESCGAGLICDEESGECVEAQCTGPDDCGDREVCMEGRCEVGLVKPLHGLCAGCGRMSSETHTAVIVLSPMEQASGAATADGYRLESGTITVLRQ